MNTLIRISDLTVAFLGSDYRLVALDNVHLSIHSGETVVIIGESGSGKSVLGQAILGLLPENAEVNGVIQYEKKNLVNIPYEEWESIRGSKLAWIPQNPHMSFNPSMKIWKQVTEPQVVHHSLSWSDARKKAIELLAIFNILPSDYWADAYPVMYSGGMLQRAMVAMGISGNPRVIIADEPTKGIDQVNKGDIVGMFTDMKKKGITQIIITHDLDFAAELADRIVVIYCGQIVEITSGYRFFSNPRHPYSRALLDALPQNGLHPIPGSSPLMIRTVNGCRFQERCAFCNDACKESIPIISVDDDYVRCITNNCRERAHKDV